MSNPFLSLPTWHYFALFGGGFLTGVIVAGMLTFAFWKGFFEGFVVEITLRFADALLEHQRSPLKRRA